jgi:hypothetical protein
MSIKYKKNQIYQIYPCIELNQLENSLINSTNRSKIKLGQGLNLIKVVYWMNFKTFL